MDAITPMIYHPALEAQWAAEGKVLPKYVRQEFDEYLKCGRLEHGFLRVQCDTCYAEHLILGSSRTWRQSLRILQQSNSPDILPRSTRKREKQNEHTIKHNIEIIANVGILLGGVQCAASHIYY